MKHPLTVITGLSLCCGLALAAEPGKDKTERKNITVITAQGTADGSSEISRESVRECIVTQPTVEALEPDVISDSRFLKEVGADPAKTEWTKIYTAKITINYQVFKKDLLIVATKSVEGKEPTNDPVDPPAMHRTGQAHTLHDFAEAIRTNEPAETGGPDNIWSFAAVMAGVESAKTGRSVNVREIVGT